jgi:hypothetical protein
VLARRLLMFALILLVVTAISSALAPPPRTTSAPAPEAGAPEAAAGPSVVVERTLEVGAGAPPTIAVEEGDLLSLTVRSDEAGAVELRELGALRAIAPEAPVVFDVLTAVPRSHPVVFTPAGGAERTVGTVRIVSRPE